MKREKKTIQIKKRTYSYLWVNIVCELNGWAENRERFGTIISHDVDPKAGNVYHLSDAFVLKASDSNSNCVHFLAAGVFPLGVNLPHLP